MAKIKGKSCYRGANLEEHTTFIDTRHTDIKIPQIEFFCPGDDAWRHAWPLVYRECFKVRIRLGTRIRKVEFSIE